MCCQDNVIWKVNVPRTSSVTPASSLVAIVLVVISGESGV